MYLYVYLYIYIYPTFWKQTTPSSNVQPAWIIVKGLHLNLAHKKQPHF